MGCNQYHPDDEAHKAEAAEEATDMIELCEQNKRRRADAQQGKACQGGTGGELHRVPHGARRKHVAVCVRCDRGGCVQSVQAAHVPTRASRYRRAPAIRRAAERHAPPAP
jgi:hypothetical protein